MGWLYGITGDFYPFLCWFHRQTIKACSFIVVDVIVKGQNKHAPWSSLNQNHITLSTCRVVGTILLVVFVSSSGAIFPCLPACCLCVVIVVVPCSRFGPACDTVPAVSGLHHWSKTSQRRCLFDDMCSRSLLGGHLVGNRFATLHEQHVTSPM